MSTWSCSIQTCVCDHMIRPPAQMQEQQAYWAQPQTSPGEMCSFRVRAVSRCGQTRRRTLQMCPFHIDGWREWAHRWVRTPANSVERNTPLFVLSDIYALGHMQMSFAALWSHVASLKSGASLLVSFEFGQINEPPTMAGVARAFYLPLLSSINAYAASEFGVSVLTSPMLDPALYQIDPHPNVSREVWCFPSVTRRACPNDLRLPNKEVGFCGGWFAGVSAVTSWRRFLAQRYGMMRHWYPSGCDDEGNIGIVPKVRLLVLDRANVESTHVGKGRHSTHDLRQVGARSFFDRAAVVSQATEACREGAGFVCDVTSLALGGGPNMSFGEHCQLFGSFDVLVVAHGAGLANLWCAVPGAAVVEVLVPGNATQSMYTPLASQMGAHYCSVGIESGTFFTPIKPHVLGLRTCVRSSVHAVMGALILKSRRDACTKLSPATGVTSQRQHTRR